MKTLSKAIAAASLATVATVAQAGTSVTVGAVSEYYYRGANLGDAGAYASVDYENAGFYAGVWAIDDGATQGDDTEIAGGDGLEVDYYLGYGGEVEGFSYGIGFTRYEYTYSGDFEQEIALSVGFGGFGVEYVEGESEDALPGSPEQDYDVISLSWSDDVFGVTVAQVSTDDVDGSDEGESEYSYAEISGSQEIGGFSFTATAGTTFDGEANSVDQSSGDGYIVLDISKSFDL